MADLTLQQRFGKDVSYEATTKKLTIDLNNFSTIINVGIDVGLDVSDMTAANQDTYANGILWALLQLSKQNQPENNKLFSI